MSESDRHHALKWMAIQWLWSFKRCRHISTETKVGNYIFDVLGCDGSRVYIIEAKQSQADFLKDYNDPRTISENIERCRQQLKESGDKKGAMRLIKREKKKSSKFFDESLLKLSSFRYIIAPSGVVTEVPSHWGVISENLVTVEKCEGNKIEQRFADKIVREICDQQTRRFLVASGVRFGKTVEWPVFDGVI